MPRHIQYVHPQATFVCATLKHRQVCMRLIKTHTYSHHCHTCLPPPCFSPSLWHTNSLGGNETQKQITGTFMTTMCICMRCTSLCFVLLGCVHNEFVVKEGLVCLLIMLAVWEKQTLKRHFDYWDILNMSRCGIKSLSLYESTLLNHNTGQHRKEKKIPPLFILSFQMACKHVAVARFPLRCFVPVKALTKLSTRSVLTALQTWGRSWL